MELKELLIALRTQKMDKHLKREMFEFYNSMVGKSKYFRGKQNPKTSCGSCISNVETCIWKWYHNDESAPTYSELQFGGRLGINNRPLYGIKKK